MIIRDGGKLGRRELRLRDDVGVRDGEVGLLLDLPKLRDIALVERALRRQALLQLEELDRDILRQFEIGEGAAKLIAERTTRLVGRNDPVLYGPHLRRSELAQLGIQRIQFAPGIDCRSAIARLQPSQKLRPASGKPGLTRAIDLRQRDVVLRGKRGLDIGQCRPARIPESLLLGEAGEEFPRRRRAEFRDLGLDEIVECRLPGSDIPREACDPVAEERRGALVGAKLRLDLLREIDFRELVGSEGCALGRRRRRRYLDHVGQADAADVH
jgi:hypothetical protein